MFLYKARVYNYDGENYFYMGKGKLGTRQGVCTIVIPEKYDRDAITNRYLLIPDFSFRVRHRNEWVVICMGEIRKRTILDKRMEISMGF